MNALADARKRGSATNGKGGKSPAGTASRRLAIDALVRIDDGGAYANLVLPDMLDRSELSEPDRRYVTELVYGTTRMRRACDHLVDRFVLGEVEPRVRAALRVGAYQLAMLETPPHAAVGATVGALGGRARGLVNAVLRKVAGAPVEYPGDAVRLSYPDWILDRLSTDIGAERAVAALESMNRPAEVNTRDDGYVQDPASRLVVEAMKPTAGETIVDVCAAPGGKATALAAAGATVIAADRRRSRVRLMAGNIDRLDASVPVLVADARRPALRPGSVDKVLVDAPCSGLGSLRRRPDARWRIDAEAPERLQELQVDLVVAGLELVRPGGVVTYSVCTLTAAESTAVLERVLADIERAGGPGVDVLDRPGAPWGGTGPVAHLLPDATDGMVLFRLRRRP